MEKQTEGEEECEWKVDEPVNILDFPLDLIRIILNMIIDPDKFTDVTERSVKLKLVCKKFRKVISEFIIDRVNKIRTVIDNRDLSGLLRIIALARKKKSISISGGNEFVLELPAIGIIGPGNGTENYRFNVSLLYEHILNMPDGAGKKFIVSKLCKSDSAVFCIIKIRDYADESFATARAIRIAYANGNGFKMKREPKNKPIFLRIYESFRDRRDGDVYSGSSYSEMSCPVCNGPIPKSGLFDDDHDYKCSTSILLQKKQIPGAFLAYWEAYYYIYRRLPITAQYMKNLIVRTYVTDEWPDS